MSSHSHITGRAIVIGASSGIGWELTKQLAEQGWRIAALARREDRLQALTDLHPDRIYPYVHDVRDFDVVPSLFLSLCQDLGGLDLIVYASGVMPEVSLLEYSFEKDKQMIDTNLLGGIAWLDQAAIRFEGTGHGSIVGIGSVAGDRGRRGQPVYNASKAGFHAYLEALRNRLASKGISVVTIKPGPVDTEMTAHLHFKGAMPAAEAARRILILRNRTGEHYLKLSHRFVFFVIRSLPSSIFRRLPI